MFSSFSKKKCLFSHSLCNYKIQFHKLTLAKHESFHFAVITIGQWEADIALKSFILLSLLWFNVSKFSFSVILFICIFQTYLCHTYRTYFTAFFYLATLFCSYPFYHQTLHRKLKMTQTHLLSCHTEWKHLMFLRVKLFCCHCRGTPLAHNIPQTARRCYAMKTNGYHTLKLGAHS